MNNWRLAPWLSDIKLPVSARLAHWLARGNGSLSNIRLLPFEDSKASTDKVGTMSPASPLSRLHLTSPKTPSSSLPNFLPDSAEDSPQGTKRKVIPLDSSPQQRLPGSTLSQPRPAPCIQMRHGWTQHPTLLEASSLAMSSPPAHCGSQGLPYTCPPQTPHQGGQKSSPCSDLGTTQRGNSPHTPCRSQEATGILVGHLTIDYLLISRGVRPPRSHVPFTTGCPASPVTEHTCEAVKSPSQPL